MALSLVFSFVVSLLRFTSSGQDRAEGKGEGGGGGGARRALQTDRSPGWTVDRNWKSVYIVMIQIGRMQSMIEHKRRSHCRRLVDAASCWRRGRHGDAHLILTLMCMEMARGLAGLPAHPQGAPRHPDEERQEGNDAAT